MKIISLVFALLCFLCLSAQKHNAVLLKNGNRYSGVVISRDSNTITLMGRDFNTYVFDTADILKEQLVKRPKLSSERMRSGWLHDLSFGMSFENYLGRFYPYGITAQYAIERQFNYRHSLGLECMLFINYDFAPTLGLKYRYEILAKPSTPFLTARFGNYADPFWSAGLGSRYSAGIGYQWGRPGFRRTYVHLDICRTNGLYYGDKQIKTTYSSNLLNLGFGFRF